MQSNVLALDVTAQVARRTHTSDRPPSYNSIGFRSCNVLCSLVAFNSFLSYQYPM